MPILGFISPAGIKNAKKVKAESRAADSSTK